MFRVFLLIVKDDQHIVHEMVLDRTNLLDGIQSPCQGNQGDGGVDVETQLRERAPSTRQDCDEAIYTCDFVEKLCKSFIRRSVKT